MSLKQKKIINRPGQPIRYADATAGPTDPQPEPKPAPAPRPTTAVESPPPGARSERVVALALAEEPQSLQPQLDSDQSWLNLELVHQIRANGQLQVELAVLEHETARAQDHADRLEATIEEMSSILREVIRRRELRLHLRHQVNSLGWWSWRQKRRLRNKLMQIQ